MKSLKTKVIRGLLVFTALLSAALIVNGCAGLRLQSPPSVTLAGLDVIEVNFFEQRFALTLRALNPNDVDIHVTGISFELELNGEPLARGVSDKGVKLPRMGEAVLEVTAVSDLSGLLRQLKKLHQMNQRSVSYRIKGHLVTDSFGRLNFENKGNLDLPLSLTDKEGGK